MLSLIWSLKTAILMIYIHERNWNRRALICISFKKCKIWCACLYSKGRLFTNFSPSWPHECIGQGRPYIKYWNCQCKSGVVHVFSFVGLLCAYCIIWLHVKDTETDGSSSDDTELILIYTQWHLISTFNRFIQFNRIFVGI